MKKVIVSFFLLFLKSSFAQYPQQGNPQPVFIPAPANEQKYYLELQRQREIQQRIQNELIIQREANRPQSGQKQIEEIIETINHPKSNPRAINYSLPSQAGQPGAEYYRTALKELSEMADGKRPIDIKRAVFIVENAYYGNTKSYQGFCNSVANITKLCRIKMQEKGYDPRNKVAKNMILHQFLSDTLNFTDPVSRKAFTHYPMKYDFEDYRGKQDWTKMFVLKLLNTNTGQCHSLPLLYLILAQEIGTEAYLSYSPSHTYIKFRDNKSRWNNLELTNGRLTSDAFILESGYIKANAIKNNLYMDTLSRKQLIAHCLVDLAKGYERKFNNDSFVETCLNKALKIHPNNMYARLEISNYYTTLFEYILHQTGRLRPDVLRAYYPQAVEIWKKRDGMYDWVDNSGFQEMPKEVYERWLKSLENEKNREDNERLRNTILKELPHRKN